MRVEQLGRGEPTVAIVGGIHGDEPCGINAVERLIAEAPDVREPVKLIVANEKAANANQRYLDCDLNRSFPGDPESNTHEQRLAAELSEELENCVTLALHSTQSTPRPFAVVPTISDVARVVCPRLSIDAIVTTGAFVEGRLIESVETIEVECGCQGTDDAATTAYQLSIEFLAAMGILPSETGPIQQSVPMYRLGEPVEKQPVRKYEVIAENFTRVKAGEPYARYDGHDLIARDAFFPVLLSAYGYDEIFGYIADHIGSLDVDDGPGVLAESD